MNGNFKVRGLRNWGNDIIKGKVYEYINGSCDFECRWSSGNYDSFADLMKHNRTTYEGVLEEVEESKIATPTESITIRRKKSKVIATLSIDGEFKYAQHIKLVDANGDFKTAVKMVVERLMDKWNGEDGVDLTAEVVKVGKNSVKIGDSIKVLESDFTENNYEIGGIYEVVEIENDNNPRIKKSNNVFDVVTEGFEIVKEIPQPTTKQPNRQAEVGEYVKIIKCECAPSAKVKYNLGDVLKIIEIDNLGARYGTGSCEFLEQYEYVVLENYIPIIENQIKKVKRPAKVGEWIEIVDANCGGRGNHYDNGDIMQIIKIEDEDRHFGNGAGEYLFDNEYLVLENYTPEVVEVVAETPEFVKAKVGDKIRVVKVDSGHNPVVSNGDIHTVIRVESNAVWTDKENGFGDIDQEYIIIEEHNPLSLFTQEQLMKELFNRQGL